MTERPVGTIARGDYGVNQAGIVWCPACRQDALPHTATGRCMWCDTLLVKAAVA